MRTFVPASDGRVKDVAIVADRLRVELRDGRAIEVPLSWYPRLVKATTAQRNHWELAGAGYGIHWPDVDEDLSTEGLLAGAAAPGVRKSSAHRAEKLHGTRAGGDKGRLGGAKQGQPRSRRAPSA